MDTSGRPAADQAAGHRPRERRRLRLRRDVQAEALRLFTAHGFEQTTIEEIAAAADISPRTFFRYFATKEDLVLWDEYDPLVFRLLDEHPLGEPIGEALRRAIFDSLRIAYGRDRERLLTRARLIYATPSLRAQFYAQQASLVDALAQRLSQRARVDSADLGLRVLSGAVVGGFFAALDLWQGTADRTDLPSILEQTAAVLAGTLSWPEPDSRQALTTTPLDDDESHPDRE